MLIAQGLSALDRAYASIQRGEVFGALEDVAVQLTRVRCGLQASEWRAFCRDTVQVHPLKDVIHQAPFTKRAYDKPRGYPGDAVVLDWIYGYETLPIDADPFVTELHRWEFHTPSCVSVRNRKTVLAAAVDDMASRRDRPIRVMATACGHLREAEESTAVKSGRVAEYLALDQDRESLTIATQASPVVRPIHGSVRGILANKIRYADLDLVYAAGLYDYLGDAIAIQLTSRLFQMLAPGGRLLIANFNPDLRDIGYLEAYMDWQLIYRTDEEVAGCAHAVLVSEIQAAKVFREPAGNISFLELQRGDGWSSSARQ
jgi:extracellular factor (EF) 3-hydroxypalmitic acid methyl ester biosynthesis protein